MCCMENWNRSTLKRQHSQHLNVTQTIPCVPHRVLFVPCKRQCDVFTTCVCLDLFPVLLVRGAVATSKSMQAWRLFQEASDLPFGL